jgi:hypothetical protein
MALFTRPAEPNCADGNCSKRKNRARCCLMVAMIRSLTEWFVLKVTSWRVDIGGIPRVWIIGLEDDAGGVVTKFEMYLSRRSVRRCV